MNLLLTVDGGTEFCRNLRPQFTFCIEGESPTGNTIDRSELTVKNGKTTVLQLHGETNQMSFVCPLDLEENTDYSAVLRCSIGGTVLTATRPFSTTKRSIGGQWILSEADGLFATAVRFDCKKSVTRARLFATALGTYCFRINDQTPPQGYLAPGYTDYSEYVYFDTYDITSYIKEKNAICVYLGKGWYCGHNFLKRAFYGEKPLFRAEIELTYADGSTETVATDRNWKRLPSPYLEADNLDGTTFDESKNLPFSDPNFDLSSYPTMTEGNDGNAKTTYFQLSDVKILPQQNNPTAVYERVAAKSVERIAEDEFIVDLGQNFGGVAEFVLRGTVGKPIVIRYAEMLEQKDGRNALYTANLRSAKATDVYLPTEETARFVPLLTFHGFRYVGLKGVREVRIDDVVGLPFCTDCPRTGYIVTENDDFNRLYSNVLWGQRSNFINIPTDCPQRDERAGWSGDAEVFCGTANYNLFCENFYEKYMRDVRTSGKYTPYGTPADWAPTLRNEVASPAWGDVAVVVPYMLYQFYGDKRVIVDNIEIGAKWVDFLENSSYRHLLYGVHSYGDWLSHENTPKVIGNTLCFAKCAAMMAEMAQVIGKDEYVKKYTKLYSEIRASFRKAFVKKDGSVMSDTQTAYALCIENGIYKDAAEKEIFAKRLAENIRRRGNLLSSGFVGVAKLCPMLCECGFDSVAYDLLLQDKYPSWLYSVRNGATTVWERWNSYTVEDGFGDVSMNSFNHYSLGAVIEWAYRTMVGIDGKAGYSRVNLCPHPDERMGRTYGEYRSVRGKISVSWELKGKDFFYSVTLPVGMTAELTLPCADIRDENGKTYEGTITLCGGKHTFFGTYLPSGKTTDGVEPVSEKVRKKESLKLDAKYNSYVPFVQFKKARMMAKRKKYTYLKKGM